MARDAPPPPKGYPHPHAVRAPPDEKLQLQTACSTVLLEKLTVPQPVKTFHTYYRTWKQQRRKCSEHVTDRMTEKTLVSRQDRKIFLVSKTSRLSVGPTQLPVQKLGLVPWGGDTRWPSWLRHCATSWKVAGSIPDWVTGILHRLNPSGCTMFLGSTQPRTEMSTRNLPWVVNPAGA
jgi:hypothetical protein